MSKLKQILICFTVFVLFTGKVWTQEDQPAPEEKTLDPRALLYFIDLSAQEIDSVVRDVLVNRLTQEMRDLEFPTTDEPLFVHRPVPTEIVDPNTGETNSGTIRPKDFFADLPYPDVTIIVAVFYRLEGSSLLIQFALYDPITGTGVGGLFVRARAGLTLFNSVNDAINELRPVLEDYMQHPYEYVQPQGRVERIHVTSNQEQIQVFFAGKEVGSTAQGELLVPYSPFRIGTSVRMELRKPGYHSQISVVQLDDAEVDLQLPELWQKSRMALQAYWTLGMARGAGLALDIYTEPDQSFFRIYTHLHDNTYHELEKVSPSFNYDFGLLYGSYIIFPPESFVRLSVGFGVGVYRTTFDNPNLGDFADVYLNLGAPTLELNLKPIQFFARVDLKYALGIGDNLLGRVWIQTVRDLPNISMGVQLKW